MTARQHRLLYVIALGVAWSAAALALDCIDRSRIVPSETTVPLVLIWGGVLLMASLGIGIRTWRSPRRGAVLGLYFGIAAVCLNAAVGALSVCIQRHATLGGLAWGSSYLAAFLSVVVVPVSWIVARFSAPQQ